MAEQHKPGEIVKTSGIYKVVHEGDSRGAVYELLHGATHSHKHSELGSGDKT
ncbi:hypothetical protein [Paraburkholderia diazotrophica]|uniref:hypothetical protein n=1 Tax=Paraburkholderia diazotrophica TaxID=667676 RepID=UPI00317BDD59